MLGSTDLTPAEKEVFHALNLGYSQKRVAEATKRPHASVRKDRERLAKAVAAKLASAGLSNIGIAKLSALAAAALASVAAIGFVLYRLVLAPTPTPPTSC